MSHQIPDVPELTPENAEVIRKNWWVYLMIFLLPVMASTVTHYIEQRDERPCNDMNTYLLKKIDSIQRDQVLYMRSGVEKDKENRALVSERDSLRKAIRNELMPPAKTFYKVNHD